MRGALSKVPQDLAVTQRYYIQVIYIASISSINFYCVTSSFETVVGLQKEVVYITQVQGKKTQSLIAQSWAAQSLRRRHKVECATNRSQQMIRRADRSQPMVRCHSHRVLREFWVLGLKWVSHRVTGSVSASLSRSSHYNRGGQVTWYSWYLPRYLYSFDAGYPEYNK